MKNEKGITILALIITLTIMAIIGFTIFYTASGIDENVEDDVLIADLQTVHHIVLQEYNKKLTLGDGYTLKGEKIKNIGETNDELGQVEAKLNQGVEVSKKISFIRKTTDGRYYEYYKLTDINNQLERCEKCNFRLSSML